MFLTHLHLKNYRNYAELDLLFDQRINIFQGNNAQGKTNIVEAIYLLALAKSHRTAKEKELVQWGQSFSVIKGTVERTMGNVSLEIQITDKGKKAKINALEQKKLSDYIGAFNVILFAPEDLTLVKGSPQYRRKFLDIEIGQIQPSYLYHLAQYQKVLQQRNNLLKDFSKVKKNKLEMLEIWNVQMVEHGAKILDKRLKFLKKLEKRAQEVHDGITEGMENLNIYYKSSIPLEKGLETESDIRFQFERIIEKYMPLELNRGTSMIGPHRDDLDFYINQIDVRSYGSQGQQRTTALSLKLAEIELIHEEIGEYPILLLDDVLSELDKKRQTHLIKTIENKVQTMITTTTTEGIDLIHLNHSSNFYVSMGKVTKKD
ncbi:DNA replication/repair protein RecF [Tepidibacillus fermentans]|uniref:DNA replication and repair protein RecF n=1 Tax=Tepidibacillus fermentans TaxID=1281767 RepID=A0A4R3KCI6_9BACI|nr:DNA replication/repair protein RecF [Tepidibacillus fermentans]TCS80827.1 DNA replication and repair protein RecF [Tepidibacillus fermentans]